MQAAKRAFVSSPRVIQTKPLRAVFLTHSVLFTLSLRSSSLAEHVPANVPSSLCIFPEHIYFRVRRVRYHPHELEHNLKFSRKNLCPFTSWSPSFPRLQLEAWSPCPFAQYLPTNIEAATPPDRLPPDLVPHLFQSVFNIYLPSCTVLSVHSISQSPDRTF